MEKYKVKLQSVINATLWVECSDEAEAKSIEENTWQPMCDTRGNAGVDPTIEAVYDYKVFTHSDHTYCIGLEQV